MPQRRRRNRFRLLALTAVLLTLTPQTGFAASTRKAPYDFAFDFMFCVPESRYGNAKCSGTLSADAAKGRMRLNLQIAAPGTPAQGYVVGFGVVIAAVYLSKPAKKVPVVVTIALKSARASTPAPASAAVTGSVAVASIGASAILAENLVTLKPSGEASRTIVFAGAPPTGPPPVPPPVPPATDLSSSVGKKTITLKFSITNGKRLVPAGIVGIGVFLSGVGVLGGKPLPTPDFLGPMPSLPDAGAVRVAADLTVTSIKVG